MQPQFIDCLVGVSTPLSFFPSFLLSPSTFIAAYRFFLFIIESYEVSKVTVFLFALAGHTDSVTSVAFSQDGLLVATAGLDSVVKIWNAQTGAQVRLFPQLITIVQLSISVI
jgi:WD40 repeat protein